MRRFAALSVAARLGSNVMPIKMNYQLVLQFDASNAEDLDLLIEIEDRLERALGSSHEVDGHDYGSGEMNIFIHTNSPYDAFDVIKRNLTSNEIKFMKAAFRGLEGEIYSVLWPEGFSGEFKVA